MCVLSGRLWGSNPSLVVEDALSGEREAPALARQLQSRWTEHAKAHLLAGRDERALWERFRAACNAVFEARDAARKEVDERKREHRRGFEQVIEAVESLAQSTEPDEGEVRRRLRELQQQWKDAAAAGPVPPARDNQGAADFLVREVGTSGAELECLVVRPDTLHDGDLPGSTPGYALHETLTSSLFKPDRTSGANVARLLCELACDEGVWERWKGEMPVIVDEA